MALSSLRYEVRMIDLGQADQEPRRPNTALGGEPHQAPAHFTGDGGNGVDDQRIVGGSGEGVHRFGHGAGHTAARVLMVASPSSLVQHRRPTQANP